MRDLFRVTKERDLSELVAGRTIAALSVSTAHELLLLVCDERQVRERSKNPLSYDALFFVVGDDWHLEIKLQKLTMRFPKIQMLSQDAFLISSARSGDAEKSAVVFDREGRELRRFRLGDALADLRSTREGVLWASYFDEGWATGSDFVSVIDSSRHVSGALKTFDWRGGFRRHFEEAGIDSYALNVTDEATWCLGYPGFVTSRIIDEKVANTFKCPVAGSRAFTVAGGIVWERTKELTPYAYDSSALAFYGAYGAKNAVSTCRFKDRELVIDREALSLEGVTMPFDVMGVGSLFHVVQGEAWLRFDMADLL